MLASSPGLTPTKRGLVLTFCACAKYPRVLGYFCCKGRPYSRWSSHKPCTKGDECFCGYQKVFSANLSGSYYGWKTIKKLTRPKFEGEKKKVVVLGSGWGALSVINHLQPTSLTLQWSLPETTSFLPPFYPA